MAYRRRGDRRRRSDKGARGSLQEGHGMGLTVDSTRKGVLRAEEHEAEEGVGSPQRLVHVPLPPVVKATYVILCVLIPTARSEYLLHE